MSNQIVLNLPGMKCGNCVSTVEDALNNLAGVDIVNIDFDSKTVEIDTDIPETRLVMAIRSAGFDVEITESL